MRQLRTNPVDLIFLDIQMPELSGLEFATILPPTTMIIFTTAFDRYAVDSYKVNCVGYLLKPIAYEQFLQASTKALAYIVPNAPATRGNAGTAAKGDIMADRFLYVKSDYKIVRIFFDDILFVEGLKDYVCFHLRPEAVSPTQPKKITSLMSMKNLEDALPANEFMRVHRSYIVHMPLVDVFDRFRIVFGETFVPVSESYRDNVQQYINAHMI